MRLLLLTGVTDLTFELLPVLRLTLLLWVEVLRLAVELPETTVLDADEAGAVLRLALEFEVFTLRLEVLAAVLTLRLALELPAATDLEGEATLRLADVLRAAVVLAGVVERLARFLSQPA